MWVIIMQIMLVILASLLTLSADSFWGLWVSLEVFSFLLLPWLLENETKISKVQIFFYFLMQFLASIGFLVSSMTFFNKLCLVVLFSSLLMKMACFPFHSWFVNILPYISWEKILLLVSVSKLVPLTMLNLFNPPQGFTWILVLGLLVPLSGFNTSCVRSIVAYSSVAHSSWLVICILLNKTASLLYILSYYLISLPLCVILMVESMTSMKVILVSKKEQINLIITILALSGIPPFLGFIPKLMVIQGLVSAGALVEASALGMLTVLPIYFYFKTGLLSLGMKVYGEFVFSNSVNLTVFMTLGFSILALICLMLGSSLL